MDFWYGALLVLLSLIFPTIPVWILEGCGGEAVLNLVLTILFCFPGTIHAWYIICREPRNKAAQGPPAIYVVGGNDLENQLDQSHHPHQNTYPTGPITQEPKPVYPPTAHVYGSN